MTDDFLKRFNIKNITFIGELFHDQHITINFNNGDEIKRIVPYSHNLDYDKYIDEMLAPFTRKEKIEKIKNDGKR